MKLVKSILKLPGTIIKFLLMTLVRIYKKFLSPVLPQSCRYYPTCSSYSLQAFEKHGAIKGLYLSVHRIIRCNPFSSGGMDPVPESFNFCDCSSHKK